MSETDRITLSPGDFLQTNFGLKLENVGKDNITFKMPHNYTITPYVIDYKEVNQSPELLEGQTV